MTQVLLMDDHPAVRKGVAVMLEDLGMRVAGEADCLKQGLLYAKAKAWDVAVIDLHLPDGDGYEFIKELRSWGVAKPILVHSQVPDSTAAKRVFEFGGNGFLNKGSSMEDFGLAVKKVSEGGSYISPAYAEVLAMGLCRKGSQLHDSLSESEFKVMCLMASGKRNSEIAKELGVSPNTISPYRARILAKLQLNSTTDIMRYALKHNLVTL